METHFHNLLRDMGPECMRYWRIQFIDPITCNAYRATMCANNAQMAIAFVMMEMEPGTLEIEHSEGGILMDAFQISYELYRQVEMAETPEEAEAPLAEVDSLLEQMAGLLEDEDAA